MSKASRRKRRLKQAQVSNRFAQRIDAAALLKASGGKPVVVPATTWQKASYLARLKRQGPKGYTRFVLNCYKALGRTRAKQLIDLLRLKRRLNSSIERLRQRGQLNDL